MIFTAIPFITGIFKYHAWDALGKQKLARTFNFARQDHGQSRVHGQSLIHDLLFMLFCFLIV